MNPDVERLVVRWAEAIEEIVEAQEIDEVRKSLVAVARGDDVGAAHSLRRYLPLISYALHLAEEEIGRAKSARNRGRPKVAKFSTLDAYRAYSTWALVKRFGSSDFSNRESIAFVRSIDHAIGRHADGVFPPSITAESAEQSLSRGKKTLEFTGPWESKICEDLFKDLEL